MYDTILIATDGSDRTRTAIAHGLGLAETYGATVHVVYVVDSRAVGFDEEGFAVDDILDSLAERGRRVTAAVAEQANERGLDTETAVVQGTPAKGIRQYATEHDVDLITIGTRGRRGVARHLLGSVAESVLRKATQPVLTTKTGATERPVSYDRILLPTDGSTPSERVAEHAFDIATHYGATVHLLSVIDGSLIQSPALLAALEEASEAAVEAAKRQGRRQGANVVSSVWKGTPGDCLTTYAADEDIDLITMGVHQKRRLDRFLTQSVAERVVRTAACPVLTLR